VTYGELNRRANGVARRLRSLGVGAEAVVGVCVERSAGMVVALLGVLKAGAAYLPLDPQYPAARLEAVLEDAGVAVLLTQASLADKVSACSVPEVICVDEGRPDDDACGGEDLEVKAAGESLAYVIYTSGSTGKPNGVQITRRGLLNLVSWHNKIWGLTAGDRVAQIAGVAFDASAWEIWPTLAAGATLYLPHEHVRVSPELLRDWLVEQSITVSFVPTPLAEQLLQVEWPRETALRTLLTGGDRLHLYPTPGQPFTLVNNYGPTENSVVTTAGVIDAEASPDSLPPIGRPIANTKVYLLDAHLRPVPVGVPGELYINGAGLARGYLNRPALTAERFIPDPFSAEPGSRLYRTGDLARYLPDGNIEFLGRLDHQVKLRGYRIELGEIESALREHALVSDCLVLVPKDEAATARLVAYVVPSGLKKPSARELREHLSKRLPEYMIPAAFVMLAEFPLTRNGKIDRNALPAAETSPEPAGALAVPRTRTQKALADLWTEALGLQRIGLHDNFFEVGGHSLLATQMVWKIREAFQVDLSLRSIFESSTISQQSELIESLQGRRLEASEPAIVPLGREQYRMSGASRESIKPPGAFKNRGDS
jgi:amino acid adenylation domain-containing protein